MKEFNDFIQYAKEHINESNMIQFLHCKTNGIKDLLFQKKMFS